jgi:endonuclease YncB( thermonuclease family)
VSYIYQGVKYMVDKHPEFTLGFVVASVLFIVGIILTTSCRPGGEDDAVIREYYADAVRALNGRTIIIKAHILARSRVYLSGVETPLEDAPFGSEARQTLNRLVAGQRIFVKQMKGDPDNSGIVWNEYGQCVQQQLVKEGLARCTGKLWRAEEEEAKRNKRGIWSVKNVEELFETKN